MNELKKKKIVLCLSLANKTEFTFYEFLFWDVWDSCNVEILLNIHYHVRRYRSFKALSELKAGDNTVSGISEREEMDQKI